MKLIQKPQPGESAPYTQDYIACVPDDGRVLQHLVDDQAVLKKYLHGLPPEKRTIPHKAGEWTVQEVLGHIIDTERIFACRALRIARNDMTELPGFEQEDYVPYSNANNRTLDDLLAEYTAVRAASLALYNTFDEDALNRVGRASNNPLSVRAAVYITAGHELYHLRSMKENYGE